MINTVTLVGRLGQDPDVITTSSGKTITKLSLAVNEYWKDADGDKQEITNWFNCTAFGRIAEICSEYLEKGRQVAISGRLRQDKWETDDGELRSRIIIIVTNLELIGSNLTNDNNNNSRKSNKKNKNKNTNVNNNNDDDDAPF